MSGKKSKQQQPLFRQCSKCKVRVLSSALEEHVAAGCGQVYPSFDGSSIIQIQLTKLPPKSKILCKSIMDTKHTDSVIFLPEILLSEFGLQTFGWVLVRMIGGHEPEEEIALRVWLVPSDGSGIRGNMMKAHLSPNSFLIHPNFKVDEPVIIKIPSERKAFPRVRDLHIQVDKLKITTSDGNMEQKLLETIQTAFRDRMVAKGNVFQVKFYSELVTFSIVKILNQGSSDDYKCGHSEITRCTNIKPVSHDNQEYFEDDEETLLKDVGGLKNVITEISSAIRCVLDSPDSNPFRGILLHGRCGTGKSLLVQAVCNSFRLSVIIYQDINDVPIIPKPGQLVCNTLQEAFSAALRRAPCVIIMEDLERMADRNRFSNFSTDLRYQFDKLNCHHARVIVLATTSDLDSIGLSTRSALVFGRELELPIPGPVERKDILTKIMRKMKHHLTVENVKEIAESTHGFVGGDLLSLCREAADSALRSRKTYSFDMKDIETSVKAVRPSAMKEFLIEVPNVKWSDIGGQEELKFKLKQAIEWPLKHPMAFQRMGITPPKGYLMYGPPGCSKTMIAKAIATESGLNFISVKGSEIFNKWVGESEKAIQTLFLKARQVAPSIIFFDEIDSLGGERGNSSTGSSVNERVLSQLLVEIDGISPLNQVLIVAATNRPDIIDKALTRPGRLDRIIYVPLPDEETRLDIFRIRCKGMPVALSLNVDRLVSLTDGYSGAEITAVCQEAALKSLEEDIDSKMIEEKHFEAALKIVKPRISPEEIEFYKNYSNK